MNLNADINAKKLACVASNRLKTSLDDVIESDEKPSSSMPVVIDNDTTGPNTHEHCEPADAFISQKIHI